MTRLDLTSDFGQPDLEPRGARSAPEPSPPIILWTSHGAARRTNMSSRKWNFVRRAHKGAPARIPRFHLRSPRHSIVDVRLCWTTGMWPGAQMHPRVERILPQSMKVRAIKECPSKGPLVTTPHAPVAFKAARLCRCDLPISFHSILISTNHELAPSYAPVLYPLAPH